MNVGIVVLHNETVDVRIAPSLAKLMALDGGVDLDQFAKLPEALSQWTARFETVEAKFNAIRHFGLISTSDLGTFLVSNSSNYEEVVSRLMHTLVIPPRREVVASGADSRIKTALKQIFKKQEVLGRSVEDIRKHLVVPNFPIDLNESLYADFALMNGSMWITETADFRARSGSGLDRMRTASFAAVKLDRAKSKFENAKTFIVYAASTDMDVSSQLHLMGKYADRLVNIESQGDVTGYTQALLDAAGLNQQLRVN